MDSFRTPNELPSENLEKIETFRLLSFSNFSHSNYHWYPCQYHFRLYIMADIGSLLYTTDSQLVSAQKKVIKGVIFDMDGTLVHEAIDYAAMRTALAMPYPLDVIVEVRKLTDVQKQTEYALISG